jgi:hypothetical protein
MSTITLRRDKGFSLTFDEMDDNFALLSGQIQNINATTVSDIEPLNPRTGDLWFNTSPVFGTGTLLLWNETAWVQVVG